MHQLGAKVVEVLYCWTLLFDIGKPIFIHFHSNPKERQWQRVFRLPHNYTLHMLASELASMLMLKILQSKLQDYVNWEFPDVQAGFRSNWQHLLVHRKSKVPEKPLLLFHWLRQSLWLRGSQQTVENSWGDENIKSPYILRSLYAGQEATVRTKHGTMD